MYVGMCQQTCGGGGGCEMCGVGVWVGVNMCVCKGVKMCVRIYIGVEM